MVEKNPPQPQTPPGAIPGWSWDNKPVVTTPAQSGGAKTGGMTPSQKAVWFMRPTPLGVNTSTPAGIAQASDPSNPNANTWYDKADVEGQFASLPYVDQLLFEATAKSISSRKTGSGLFTDMVNKSAYMSTSGRKVTPSQLMYEVAAQRGVLNEDGTFDMAAARKAGGGGGGGGGGAKYGTTTDTAKSVNQTDPDTAKNLVNTALSTYLGKEASPEELSKFISNLHQHEAANPSVTSRTTTTSPGGSSSSQDSVGGSNAQQYAQDWARAQEGSAEFQAAGSYFDEFIKAIQNPMDVVK